jgi:hypothetical protein
LALTPEPMSIRSVAQRVPLVPQPGEPTARPALAIVTGFWILMGLSIR